MIMNNKILIGSIIAISILIGVSFTSVVGKGLELYENVYLQQDKELTREHLKYLFRGFLFIQDSKIKEVIKKTIFEIIKNGNATSEEIQEIINSSNVNIVVYILAQIKTVGDFNESDGSVRSVPFWHSIPFFSFNNAKGILVEYTPECKEKVVGWNLQIDGNLISENNGCILGYTGHIENVFYTLPLKWETFILDGFGVLVLHYSN